MYGGKLIEDRGASKNGASRNLTERTMELTQPFHNNEDVYRICRRCHEPDRLNKDNLCSDCVHQEKLQVFADNVADLVVSGNYDNKIMLQAVIESAQLLRRR